MIGTIGSPFGQHSFDGGVTKLESRYSRLERREKNPGYSSVRFIFYLIQLINIEYKIILPINSPIINYMIKRTFVSNNTFSTLKAFSVVDSVQSSDLNIKITRLHHKPSGAYVYHLLNDDPNNCFSPIVKTLPQNNKGCPHILQHLACCGSQKYPIRDPFFNMIKRSVNTYMNAWTGQDFTAYPFSSANSKDFDNLYSVYLDMTLKPLLNELDFRQEGWRYQIDENGNREIKGIVFNEMKGAYQNSQRQLFIEIQKRLFGGSPFEYDSGGKPSQIIKLSYDEVRKMHEYYYHPSNTSFMFYGNSDIDSKLQMLGENYLRNYSNEEGRYRKKIEVEEVRQMYSDSYSQNAQCNSVSINFNLGNIGNISQLESMCLQILSYVLLQTNQAQVYKYFVEGNLCESLGSGGYWPNTLSTFNIMLKGISPQKEGQQFYRVLQRMLLQLMEKGIGQERISEFVQQTQIDLLTPKNNNGIRLLQIGLPYFNNRLQLINMTHIRSTLKEAIRVMTNKESLKQFIKKHLLNNNKKVVIRQLRKQNSNDSNRRQVLQGVQMSDGEIIRQQQQLKKRQSEQEPESINCLPKIRIGDLIMNKHHQHTVVGANGSTTHKHISIKSNLHFYRFVFRVDSIDKHIMQALHIWKYSINKGISTKQYNYQQLSSKLNQVCANFNVNIDKGQKEEINIIFSGICQDNKKQQFIQLVRQIIQEPVYDTENIHNIFSAYQNQVTEVLIDNPISQCLDYCGDGLNNKSTLFNSYAWMTNGLNIASTKSTPEQFKSIHHILSHNSSLTIIQHSKIPTQDLLSAINLTSKSINQSTSPFKPLSKKVAVIHNYDVNFCSQAYLAPSFLSTDDAHLSLLLQILEQDYLHPKIREEGGAYGAKATIRQNGTVVLFSYRDPNSKQTFDVFDQSIQKILQSQISDKQLQQAKIKVVGDMDRPIVPQDQCVSEILKNYENEKKKQYRQVVLKAKKEQLIEAGKKYLQGNKNCVVFGKQVPEGFVEQKLKISK